MILKTVRRLHAGQLVIVTGMMAFAAWLSLLALRAYAEDLSGCSPGEVTSCKVTGFWVEFSIIALIFFASTAAIPILWWSWFGARRPRQAITRAPFRPGELETQLDQLAYEWVMFDFCRSRWQSTRDVLALECLLLHVRTLRDFLFSRLEEYGSHLDKAILASDFAPNWSPNKGSRKYKILWETDRAINAQVAHISRNRTDRLVQRNLGEDAEAIAAAVADAWAGFRDAMGVTLCGRVDAAMARERTRLGIQPTGESSTIS